MYRVLPSTYIDPGSSGVNPTGRNSRMGLRGLDPKLPSSIRIRPFHWQAVRPCQAIHNRKLRSSAEARGAIPISAHSQTATCKDRLVLRVLCLATGDGRECVVCGLPCPCIVRSGESGCVRPTGFPHHEGTKPVSKMARDYKRALPSVATPIRSKTADTSADPPDRTAIPHPVKFGTSHTSPKRKRGT